MFPCMGQLSRKLRLGLQSLANDADARLAIGRPVFAKWLVTSSDSMPRASWMILPGAVVVAVGRLFKHVGHGTPPVASRCSTALILNYCFPNGFGYASLAMSV
jgi:hypothetical protein